MSRGFVREEDQEEAVFIPPRAALPLGVINYVTPQGYQLLLNEKHNLENQRKNLSIEDEKEKRKTLALLDGKMNLLQERIVSARILEPEEQPAEEIRFGAQVELKEYNMDKKLKFQIVGVDEADVKKQKIAFIAPIAKSVTGKAVGDIAELKLGSNLRKYVILKINYTN